MPPKLPSTNSIEDFLKSQGKDSSFGARSKMYRESGLDKRLGSFIGAPNQNLALLNQLKNASKPTTPQITQSEIGEALRPKPPVSLESAISANRPSFSTVLPGMEKAQLPPFQTPINQPRMSEIVPRSTPAPSLAQTVTPPSTYQGNSIVDFLNSIGKPTDFKSRTSLAEQYGIKDYRGSAEQNLNLLSILRGESKTATASAKDQQTKQNVGISASEILGSDTTPDEEDLVNDWLSSPEGKLFLDRQELKDLDARSVREAAKAELEANYEADRAKLEQSLASRGLAFSGVRTTQVKALADALAASLLETDREYASKLLSADLDLRDAILEGVADLAADAQSGRKEAIQQLNAIGYAVINGELVPTLASRSADRAEDAAARAERSLQLSERRLQLAEQRDAESRNIDSDTIDYYAKQLASGTISIASVPDSQRSSVVRRMKEFAEVDLLDDIQQEMDKGTPKVALYASLQKVYPEFSYQEIVDTVDTAYRDAPTAGVEASKGFFAKLFD